MSNAGEKRTIKDAARQLYVLGGVRAFYRGLGVRTILRPYFDGLTT